MSRAQAFAPATVANVAVGFDLLGFALEGVGDVVTVETTAEPSVSLTEITDTNGRELELPTDPTRNTATAGLLKLRADLQLGYGFAVSLRKGIALGSGMGGSAASAVGAVVAANALLERPLPQAELMPYALVGEQAASGAAHADNLAPCLFGGLTLVLSVQPFRHVALPVPAEMTTVLVHPHLRLDTREARRILQTHVPLTEHVRQSAHLAGFIAACYTGDLELLAHSLQDILIEPQRAPLIPAYAEVKAAALAAGALGAGIAGSGPSVFAWVASAQTAMQVRTAMLRAFAAHGLTEVDAWTSPVSHRGATIIR
ncbi:MAG TPA: homoserine kinase [Pyrinomonadaceae bacterium]|jgi:homoserine kinase